MFGTDTDPGSHGPASWCGAARRALAAAAALALYSAPVLAAPAGGGGGGLPWESTLQRLQQSLSGPVASAVAVIAVAAAGMILAMGGVGTLARIALSLVIGLGLALGANSVVTTLFTAPF